MSKYKRLLDVAKQRTSEAEPELLVKEKEEGTLGTTEPSAPTPATPPAQGRGRPRGKRSHPDYEQVTAYIRKETYRQVKIALLQETEQREFSELVEELLRAWLDERR